MRQNAIRSVFMRGGTSKALIFHVDDLPSDRADWADIFLGAMGSPDPYSRQLDGMGGGISSLSKVCVVGPPSRADADADYTFCQVSPRDAQVDYAGNCGNMTSAIGPFAVDEGLVDVVADGLTTVRIHNTNTNKIIRSTFKVCDGRAEVDGNLRLDGVAGSGSPIKLDFLDPGGARTGHLFPTGNLIDVLDPVNVSPVEASLVDASNPTIFVRAADFGLTGVELPSEIDAVPGLLETLETLRRLGAVKMGLATNPQEAGEHASQPKIALLSSPTQAELISGRTVEASEQEIQCRMISMGQTHLAIPITGALCLAVACRVSGTIAEQCATQGSSDGVRIGHPSGVLIADAKIDGSADCPLVISATVFRTARRLFEGSVFYRHTRTGDQ